MTAAQRLRQAYHLLHQSETLARNTLDPATFEFLREDFDRLIRQLDELAKVELILAETTDD